MLLVGLMVHEAKIQTNGINGIILWLRRHQFSMMVDASLGLAKKWVVVKIMVPFGVP